MIGTDSATAAGPPRRPEGRGAPLLDALAGVDSEYVVEWQVADHAVLTPILTPEE